MHIMHFKIAFLLAQLLTQRFFKTVTSFLALDILNICKQNDCFIVIFAGDLSEILLLALILVLLFLFFFEIVYYIKPNVENNKIRFFFFAFFFYSFWVFLNIFVLSNYELGYKALIFDKALLYCLLQDFLALDALIYSNWLF